MKAAAMPNQDDPIFSPLKMGNHLMPAVWRYLFPDDFQWLKVPDERNATCDNCYKVKSGEYRDDCRCCTYFPDLSNFQLGLALLSESRDAVLPLVGGRFVLPMGLAPSPLRYQKTVITYAADRFGKEPSMLCPFVDPSTFHCRIYPFRNSICSTFFCTNDHGKIGNEFWDVVLDLVGQVETALAQWCMDEVGLAHETYVERLNELASDIPSMSDVDTLAWSQHAHSVLWGDWLGREVDFLEACGRLVMVHRHELFDIARQQAGRVALTYVNNLRLTIAEEIRHEAPEVATINIERWPIDPSWYRLQLIERQLWELPFHQGPIVLSEAVEIIAPPRDDAWSATASELYMVRSKGPDSPPKIREIFGTAEINLLRIFEEPLTFDEALFERPELHQLETARNFLAQCLRLGILVDAG